MKNQFVSYEISLALKELGFDEECFGFYSDRKFNLILNLNIPSLWRNSILSKDKSLPTYISAILYQQVFEFFKEKYSIEIFINSFQIFDETRLYHYNIQKSDSLIDLKREKDFQSYQQALEQAILECIKLIKNEKSNK